MQNDKSWFLVNNIKELDSPALLIYPGRVSHNIQTAVDMVSGDLARLRPHIKTNKTKEAVEMLIQAGVYKFKCATIAEAEILGICSAKEVLFAYQPVGPKLIRLKALMEKYPATHFSCLTDHIDAATAIAQFFADADITIDIYLDINGGMNRSGILVGDAAVLYKQCSALKGIRAVGLHVYDGNIRDVDIETRKQKCDSAFTPIEKLQSELEAAGLPKPVIIAGGSPTFSIHSKRMDIECSPGTFIFWDKGYSDLCPEQDFQTAALVICRVISLPAAGKICVDLGHKSVAAENDIARRVFFLNATSLKPVSQSEEHLVLDAGTDHTFKIGDVLYGLPFHICPTVALYERGQLVTGNQVKGEWRIMGRDRKISI